MKYCKGKNLVLKDKRSIFIAPTVIIGNNVTIYENVRIEGKSEIKDGATIMPGCYIVDTVIGERTTINYSQTEDAFVGNDCYVGPFARLRPKAVVCDKAKIGNFVEIKNATIGEGSKVNHLAYVGDADIGRDCNIGCGAIFVNYNGRTKSRTTVGDECFIGSNCNVIAPVKIESRAYICAGTTITDEVHTDDFVIGRVRQTVKENRAHEYLKEKKENK
ncbi:MAG: UDP-N-acetylglucosamine diphosphorylase [Clostridiales bacterium]|nr:UDP-N-acetylglucosamine diphosphorylase [Clostridiales bacterium]